MNGPAGTPEAAAHRDEFEAAAAESAYQRGWRRVLVDMEIPDWDERFLSEYDPIAMADLYARADLSSVMFACKNLGGLCFWPTEVGEMHPRLDGRDVVGETADALEDRGIAVCAYYSVIFDNWAFEHDADWRFEPIGGRRLEGSPRDRHGHCCPNSPGYRDYVAAQIADLYGRYEFECAFCDMSFWPGVCGCLHCRERFRTEARAEIPEVIDWAAPEWCAFQAARERWIGEFQGLITDAMRSARPGIAVYHNFAIGPIHWSRTVPFSITEHSDFLGGDMYGDELEQLLVIKLMNGLSRSRPVEYMTFATLNHMEHVQLKGPERLRRQVLAATAESAAFMFIDAVDPQGTANSGHYDLIRQSFEPAKRFADHLGGEPIADVALYFSNESKMDLGENGASLAGFEAPWTGYPHLEALRGAARALQCAHIPFAVITRKQLGELDRYPVVVLPSVTRMDAEEVTAIREHVSRGGRVYVSGRTSLLESSGVHHRDFQLADVLGIHLASEEEARVVYVTPAIEQIGELIDPQRHVTFSAGRGGDAGSLLQLGVDERAQVLAKLTLPYGHPDVGDLNDRRWASIHSFPPTEDARSPLIVEHRFGEGRTIYSAVEFERDDANAAERLFIGLIRRLLGGDWSLGCDAHPQVWLSGFHHADERAIRIALLNPPPAVVGTAEVSVRPPTGARFVAVESIPSGASVPFTTGSDGTARCALESVPELAMLRATYADETGATTALSGGGMQ